MRIESYALPEGWGVTGGRTDLTVYLHQRHVVHIELFGSSSTVSRDVNNLHMSRADVRVALIIDKEADPKVSELYFRTVPDNRFHWYWLSQFLDPVQESTALVQLEDMLVEAIQLGGPLTALRPTATINPASGPPFSRVNFRVTGFHPDRDFTVFWEPSGPTCAVGACRGVNTDGTAECTILIPHGGIAARGRHMLRAVDSLGNIAETEFEVTSAWPIPYMRVMPRNFKPGDILHFVGGGAPANSKLTIFFWQNNSGDGVANIDVNNLGEFAGSFNIPFTRGGFEVIEPGRHRISVTAWGGYIFETHTYILTEEAPFPDPFEWRASSSHWQESITIERNAFRVQGERLRVMMNFHNDRDSEVLLEDVTASIIESGQNVEQKIYELNRVTLETGPIWPGRMGPQLRSAEFSRLFDPLPPLAHGMTRQLNLCLFFQTKEVGALKLIDSYNWPGGIWTSKI